MTLAEASRRRLAPRSHLSFLVLVLLLVSLLPPRASTFRVPLRQAATLVSLSHSLLTHAARGRTRSSNRVPPIQTSTDDPSRSLSPPASTAATLVSLSHSLLTHAARGRTRSSNRVPPVFPWRVGARLGLPPALRLLIGRRVRPLLRGRRCCGGLAPPFRH
ncbi:hypothetical protein BAE44_0005061 [Dichanthelium oligosanthes]|uniref:Uncharacterized protein n=1 Tax=Dichanthelium oligosanthes TaxID=888268 RepID=A0A1E5W9J6_9POAL|nr:hypothetical protein BAE44_0005061 [Dichanthelium oligosanthes]